MSVHFMHATDGGAIKIGTAVDVDRRQKQLECLYGQPLQVLKVRPGGEPEERAMHERFKAHRIGRTEQFRPGHDLMEFLGQPVLVDQNHDTVEAMPTKREGRFPASRYASVKLDKAVVVQAKILAAREGTSIGDLLSDMLQTPITKAYRRMLCEIAGGEE